MKAFLHDVKHDVVVASVDLGEVSEDTKVVFDKLKDFLNKEAHISALRGYLQLVFAKSFDYVEEGEEDDDNMRVVFHYD